MESNAEVLRPGAHNTVKDRILAYAVAKLIFPRATAGHALGLLDGLARLADPAADEVGQALAEASLPQRVRLKSKEKPTI